MKKNFKKAVLLTLAVVGMGMFNSCKDSDLSEENRIDIETLKDKLNNPDTSVTDLLSTQIDELRGTLSDLEEKVGNIKDHECTEDCPVCALNEAKVKELIDAAIAANQSSDDFVNAINEIIVNGGFQTAEQVQAAIEAYNAANPGPGAGLTEDQVQALINAAIQNFVTQAALDQAVSALNIALTDAEATLNAAIGSTNADLAALTQEVNRLNIAATTAIGNLESAVADLQNSVNALDGLPGDVQALQSELQLQQTELTQLRADLDDAIAAWTPQVQEAAANAAAALAKAEANDSLITGLQKSYEELAASCEGNLKNAMDSLANEMKDFATKEALRDVLTAAELMNAEAIAYTQRVETWTAETLGELQAQFAPLEAQIGELNTKIEEVEGKVKANTDAITAIQGYLKKLITGIIVQGTSNPVFGSFAFPWGLQSNILMGYYGENTASVPVSFPTTDHAPYVYGATYALTPKDKEMLGYEAYQVPAGDFVDNVEGNAGKIYLTVNPTNVNFDGTNSFTLVNSQDKESPVKLGTLKKSDATLQFGWTRAANNGFYEAPANFTVANIPSTGVDIDVIKKNLKAIAKDALDYKNGLDLKATANSMYKIISELNCNLDANGVKAAWTAEGQEVSVYSKYEVAAFAVKPLSYNFLYDANLGTAINNKIPALPTISPLTDAIINDLIDLEDLELNLNLNLKDLELVIDPINVEIPPISLGQVNLTDMGKVTVEVPTYTLDPTTNELVPGSETEEVDIDAFTETMAQEINKALADGGKEVTDQLNTHLKNELNKAVESIKDSVNDLLQNKLQEVINSQLESNIKDVLGNVQDQISSGLGGYLDQANSYIDQVNSLTGRFNAFMDRVEDKLNNLNAYLQVTMMYKGGDGNLHLLSNDPNFPTVFEGEGAANLYLTSYAGDIIAPAAKKFVGVTNVLKDGDSAQRGCADCKAKLDEVNAGEYFNKVLSGSRYGVAMENLKKGYTYEIFYSGLDYAGMISARKFYVTVK